MYSIIREFSLIQGESGCQILTGREEEDGGGYFAPKKYVPLSYSQLPTLNKMFNLLPMKY